MTKKEFGCSFAAVVAIGCFVFSGSPLCSFGGSRGKAEMRRDAAHIDQIVKACKLYAMDYDGAYPTKVPAGVEWSRELEFQTSN